jgi:hypothetical protein
MAISAAQIKAYANYYLPQFQFADSEAVFPLQADTWLTQCAQGDWTNVTDPHRGTTAVTAREPLSLQALDAHLGCNGVSGSPIDPTQTLPFEPPDGIESFLDFAGWSSLETEDGFVAGDDSYISSYLSPYFAQFNTALAGNPPPARTVQKLPTTMTVYCEAAWAGAFTRLDIANNTMDFATAPTNDPDKLQPDPVLDAYVVLTYYLFYPATLAPPNLAAVPVTSPNTLLREGQWEAVSFYFKQSGTPISLNPLDMELPPDPSTTAPALVMLSAGITFSGDGHSPGLSTDYPASPYTPAPTGPNPTVYVTSGTHKNLSASTSVTTYQTGPSASPDAGWAATGAALEGAGGIVAGITGGTGVGLAVGFILWLIGFLMSLFAGDPASGSVVTGTTTSDAPDSSGDVANSGGALSGSVQAAAGTAYVAADLVVLSTLFDDPVLGGDPELAPPAWWPYPGRWGVAMASGSGGWDSGGRRIDFIGRSRAYWNTVWAQRSL